MEEARKEKSCGVLVYREKPRRYLILHYVPGHWDFPKGHVEPGEDEQQTALRELEEETGITNVTLLPGFRKTITYRFREQGRLIEKTVAFFLARAPEEQVRLSREHQNFLWLPVDAARMRVTHSTARDMLDAAEEFLSSPAPQK